MSAKHTEAVVGGPQRGRAGRKLGLVLAGLIVLAAVAAGAVWLHGRSGKAADPRVQAAREIVPYLDGKDLNKLQTLAGQARSKQDYMADINTMYVLTRSDLLLSDFDHMASDLHTLQQLAKGGQQYDLTVQTAVNQVSLTQLAGQVQSVQSQLSQAGSGGGLGGK